MEEIEELDIYDMDTITDKDGYEWKKVPDVTRRNIEMVVDKVNEMIKSQNEIIEKFNKLKG